MEKKKSFTRSSALVIIIIIMFSLLSFKLANLQIVNGEEYKRKAQDKSIRTVEDNAPRGKIVDRNGVELASNIQSYTIFMMKPQDKQENDNVNIVIERLIDILNNRGEKLNDDFHIVIKPESDGKFSYEFDFPNNYTDENERQDYIKRAADNWKEENDIQMDLNAEQTFEYLKKQYNIIPVNKDHDKTPFIRQMMVVRQMMKDRNYMAYKPVEIAYVSRDTAFEIMEKGLLLPGVDYTIKPLRTYPYGELASLIVGSLRKIPSTKIQNYVDRHYDINSDLIGRDGIEAYCEDDLKGEKGGRTVKVDANGRIVEEQSKRDPIPGNDIVLTIDKNLQEVAEKSLDSVMQQLQKGEIGKKKYEYANRGAAVVIDLKTGEILAMASRPGGYNPNVMAVTGSISVDTWKKLSPGTDEYPNTISDRIPRPMYNYATSSAVPPGSTFKMISAIAGLETGAIAPNTKIVDLGQYRVVKNFPGNCWIWNYYGLTHGSINVVEALKVSCNYFFFEVGNRVGLLNLGKYAKMFGLTNEPTGIEIDEKPGDVANPDVVKKKAVNYSIGATLRKICEPGYDSKIGTFQPNDEQKELITSMISNNDRDSSKLKEAGIASSKIRTRIIEGVRAAYYEYNNEGLPLNAAIGQGEDAFTPLQIVNYIATIGNGGTRYRPHLIKEIIGPDGTVVKEIQPEVMNKVELKSTTLPTVVSGMDAVTSEGGTAGAVFQSLLPFKTAGKTGTAQASGGMDDYSWFAGFAPAENPEIAVAVTIHEGGGYGSSNVAKEIYKYYFKLN